MWIGILVRTHINIYISVQSYMMRERDRCPGGAMRAHRDYEVCSRERGPQRMYKRLYSRLAWWLTWCLSTFVIAVIRTGYRLPWRAAPPRRFSQRNHKGAYEHASFVSTAVADLVASGAAVRWTGPSPPHCVSPLNVAVQPTKLRLILDLRWVNKHLTHVKFKYEGIPRLPELLNPGDWMFSIDLKSGYHHVDIDRDYLTYLGFYWEGSYYVFRSLPFGLAEAPHTFTRLIKQLAQRWRAHGARLIPYVYDLLFIASSREEALQLREKVLADLQASGLHVNWEKSVLAPSQRIKFLGFMVDSTTMNLSLDAKRLAGLLGKMQRVIEAARAGQRGWSRPSPAHWLLCAPRSARPPVHLPRGCCYALPTSRRGRSRYGYRWPRQRKRNSGCHSWSSSTGTHSGYPSPTTS